MSSQRFGFTLIHLDCIAQPCGAVARLHLAPSMDSKARCSAPALYRAAYRSDGNSTLKLREEDRISQTRKSNNFLCDSKTRLRRHHGIELFLTVPEAICLGSLEQEKTLCQWSSFNMSLKMNIFWNSRIWTCGCFNYHQIESRQIISCFTSTRTVCSKDNLQQASSKK